MPVEGVTYNFIWRWVDTRAMSVCTVLVAYDCRLTDFHSHCRWQYKKMRFGSLASQSYRLSLPQESFRNNYYFPRWIKNSYFFFNLDISSIKISYKSTIRKWILKRQKKSKKEKTIILKLANEGCIENIIYLSYLIPEKIANCSEI